MNIPAPKYLIKIIASVLNGSEFNPPPDIHVDFDELYAFSKRHHLAGFVAMCPKALEKMPTQIAQKFIYENNLAIARETVQAVTIGSFLDRMEEKGLRAMPLKGFYTKNLYPYPSLRYMSDTDILIDEEKIDEIHPIMEGLGFQLDHESMHEIIYKSNQLAVELHKELVPPSFGALYDYYTDPWKYAKLREDKKYIYEMSPEDAYVYTIDHIAKHYVEGGIGIMHVVDVFVMNRTALDREYVMKELEKLTLVEFENILVQLARLWFKNEPIQMVDNRVFEMGEFILGSGAYGNTENRIASRLVANYADKGKQTTRTKYLLRKIFPTAEFLGFVYPAVKKNKCLYPVYWLIRFFDIILHRRKEIKTTSVVATIKQEQIDTLDEHLRRMGLSKDL